MKDAPGSKPRAGVAIIAMSAALLFAVAPTGAGAARHSFEGSCAVVGVATFPPMSVVPDPSLSASFVYRGDGRCMGTLDGGRLPQGGAPVRVVSRGPKPVHSCALGFDPGSRWAITLYPRRAKARPRRPARPRPVTIVGTMDVADLGREQAIVARGQVSGVAVDHGQGQGHGETLEDCLRGELTSGVMTGQLDTITPLVSDDLGPAWVNG